MTLVFALLQLVRALKWLEMVIVMMKQTTYIVAVLILVTVAIHVLAQNFVLIDLNSRFNHDLPLASGQYK